MTYGIVALESHSLINNNTEINDELHEHNPVAFPIDNITQYLPTASVFALPALGIKPQNSTNF